MGDAEETVGWLQHTTYRGERNADVQGKSQVIPH